MDWEKYEVLLTVLEEGSLTRAAERLSYTPSGISRMIASLERENGFPLLVRSREGVRATEECEMLLPSVRELSYWGRRLEEQAGSIRGVESGVLRAGTSYDAFYPWLSELIAGFSAEHPGIQMDILEGTSSELTEAVTERKCDFCIVSYREGPFRFVRLLRDEVVALVPAGHPLAELDAVPLKAVEKEPFIDFYPKKETDNSRIFEKYRITPATRFATTDRFAGYAMVKAGLGLGMENSLIARRYGDTVAVRSLDPPQYVDIGIVYPEETVISPAARAFASYALARPAGNILDRKEI